MRKLGFDCPDVYSSTSVTCPGALTKALQFPGRAVLKEGHRNRFWLCHSCHFPAAKAEECLSLDRLGPPGQIDLLPRGEVAGTEEPPEVEDQPLVKGVLQPRVPQVGDAMVGQELPAGSVTGDQVEV